MSMKERKECPLCARDEKEILVDRAYTDSALQEYLHIFYEDRADVTILTDARYILARCETCGFMWQTSVLGEVGMTALYGTWIDAQKSFDKKVRGRHGWFDRYSTEVVFMKMLFQNLSPKDIRVLDFGCGWGFWARMALAHGCAVTGLEVADDRITYMEKHGIKTTCSLTELHRKQFDFINAEQVFEHIENPKETIEQLAAFIAPGGFLHIAVPDGTGFNKSSWGPEKGPTQPLEHINTFTPRTLAQLGAGAGLSVYCSGAYAMATAAPIDFSRGVLSALVQTLGRVYVRMRARKRLSTSLYFKKEV